MVRLSGSPGTSLPEMGQITALGEQRAPHDPRGVERRRPRRPCVPSDQVVGDRRERGVGQRRLRRRLRRDGGVDPTWSSHGYPGLTARGDVPRRRIIEQPGRDRTTWSRLRQALRLGSPGYLRAKAREVSGLCGGGRGSTTRRSPPSRAADARDRGRPRQGRAARDHAGDVRRAEATLLHGIQVGSVFEDQKVFDVVVQGRPRSDRACRRRRPADRRPAGGHVHLGDVADVRDRVPTPTVIRRDAVSRHVDVTASVGPWRG